MTIAEQTQKVDFLMFLSEKKNQKGNDRSIMPKINAGMYFKKPISKTVAKTCAVQYIAVTTDAVFAISRRLIKLCAKTAKRAKNKTYTAACTRVFMKSPYKKALAIAASITMAQAANIDIKILSCFSVVFFIVFAVFVWNNEIVSTTSH